MSSQDGTHNGARPVWWDDNNRRAMAICRVSDKKQLQGISLETQEHDARNYLARVGWISLSSARSRRRRRSHT